MKWDLLSQASFSKKQDSVLFSGIAGATYPAALTVTALAFSVACPDRGYRRNVDCSYPCSLYGR
jgi:hypothetical protein